jgi:hypothetical protein
MIVDDNEREVLSLEERRVVALERIADALDGSRAEIREYAERSREPEGEEPAPPDEGRNDGARMEE